MCIRDSSRYYGDSGADELFLYDMAETDEDHERTIGLIKEIARTADVPVITGGRVRRLEDVKMCIRDSFWRKRAWMKRWKRDSVN